jgi:hypothetical protein
MTTTCKQYVVRFQNTKKKMLPALYFLFHNFSHFSYYIEQCESRVLIRNEPNEICDSANIGYICTDYVDLKTYIFIFTYIVNMSDITFVKYNQNHYVKLSVITPTKRTMGDVYCWLHHIFFYAPSILLVNHFVIVFRIVALDVNCYR